MDRMPRVMITAPAIGSGKTLITCAILRILSAEGISPAAFKCGPDFIDPMFHEKVLGIPSGNLDIFLQGEGGMKESLQRLMSGKDIAIIEGVMGFFDGYGESLSEGASYDICVSTATPAILVVNCRGMSRSIIPVIKGYINYFTDSAEKRDGSQIIRGVILNNISPGIEKKIAVMIEEELNIPVIGHLPPLKKEVFGSRHLGLILPDEVPGVLARIDEVAGELKKSLDIEKLLEIAKTAGVHTGDLNCTEDFSNGHFRVHISDENACVGVAMDEVFCFYYSDNLELIKHMGAEIKLFSPIHDRELPDVTGIILGGGYPELHGRDLSENKTMRQCIKEASESGMPILAECGGYLYLKEGLTDPNGVKWDMVGVFEGESFKRDKLSHFGYINMFADVDTPYLKAGESVRGHEFHYYETTGGRHVCDMRKPAGQRHWPGMEVKDNTFGGFAHLYYPSNPEFIRRFLSLQR